MEYISKLETGYRVADPSIWLTGSWKGLDPVFAGRLAFLAQSKNKKIAVTEGYRSTERQEQLYQSFLQYKRTGKGAIKLAAKPGTSWHEFRLAIDTSTQPFRLMTNRELLAYGLCKPISTEGWHIQPIETHGEKDRKKWEPKEEEVEVEKITVRMNGKSTELNTILYKNENYMRIRDLGDAQKDDALEVSWDAKTKTVVINSK